MLDELSKRIIRAASALAAQGAEVTPAAVALATGLAVGDVAVRMRVLASVGQMP